MKSKLMFIRGVYEYHINGRDIYMLSESHQEFKSKISGCKSKGYKLIDEYVRSFDNPVVILELSDKFEKKYTQTYSTNLNILQQMDDIAKIYADIRYNIYSDYQYMYDFEDDKLECDKVMKMIDINLSKVTEFHEKVSASCNGYSSAAHKKFIDKLINDAENNIRLLCDRFKAILSTGEYKMLSDLNKIMDQEFMDITDEYKGSTLSRRIHEVIKHSWKKITDICIMIILLSKCLDHTNVIILLGAEHVMNLDYIIQQYMIFCEENKC